MIKKITTFSKFLLICQSGVMKFLNINDVLENSENSGNENPYNFL